jgi:hypothetical protein
VLGDAEPVVDRGVAAGGVEPGGAADQIRRHAGRLLDRLGAVALVADEARPVGELVELATLAHEGLVDQAFGHHHTGKRVQRRDVGAGPERQVIGRLDMGHAHEIDPARVDHDQLRALAQALHP